MVPLISDRSPIKSFIHRVPIYITIMILVGINVTEFTNKETPLVLATNQLTSWNVTLHITESGGAGNTLILGEAPTASDGLDQYDLPEPPAPPQFPFIRSWFDTSLNAPFNNLLQEYKSSSSDHAWWNLSIVWVPAPGNQSTTTVSILWNTTQIDTDHTHSLLLYKNNTIVADMMSTTSYSFITNSSLHRFHIVYQNELLNNTEKPLNLPILLITLVGVGCVLLILSSIVIIKRRKNKT